MKSRRSWVGELVAVFGRRQQAPLSSQALERVLRQVAGRLPSLRWAAVVSQDGVLQLMYDPFGREKTDRASAMAAAGFSLGERIAQELQLGEWGHTIIVGEEGLFLLQRIAAPHVLALSLPADSDISAAVDVLAQVRSALSADSQLGGA
jgi:predicted regulator of Ras-like GTPase activity (Roadblock/LC7/MglB family)